MGREFELKFRATEAQQQALREHFDNFVTIRMETRKARRIRTGSESFLIGVNLLLFIRCLYFTACVGKCQFLPGNYSEK